MVVVELLQKDIDFGIVGFLQTVWGCVIDGYGLVLWFHIVDVGDGIECRTIAVSPDSPRRGRSNSFAL